MYRFVKLVPLNVTEVALDVVVDDDSPDIRKIAFAFALEVVIAFADIPPPSVVATAITHESNMAKNAVNKPKRFVLNFSKSSLP